MRPIAMITLRRLFADVGFAALTRSSYTATLLMCTKRRTAPSAAASNTFSVPRTVADWNSDQLPQSLTRDAK